MFLFGGFESAATRKARKEREEEEDNNLLKQAKDWNLWMPFEKKLAIRAASYQLGFDLFPELKPVKSNNPNRYGEQSKHASVSENGRWLYSKQMFPAKTRLLTFSGSKSGWVIFDKPVVFPTLFRKHNGSWEEHPIMSLAPMEMFTLRTGIRKARGHTIVCGLGLGWLLIEVSKKRNVKQLTLVEKDQELVDWLWPRIEPLVQKPINIVVEDAYKALHQMKSDVALMDIYDSYGSNSMDLWQFERHGVSKRPPGIKDIWVWGAANVSDRLFY